ncbi:hypothetical protein CH300_04830 [Rhodococcus sp. 15-1154-1]|nr:WhiB family transcriptional regulator [Rhodococcus sp. 15-1154-1]OZF07746.1 hypothetical protein CH300_04830 [Rhodococcus sp. 15-1154-1]
MQARCGRLGYLFYGPDDELRGDRLRREHEAKLVCLACPVEPACRSYALENLERYGIWGGTTELDRIRAAKRLESRKLRHPDQR